MPLRPDTLRLFHRTLYGPILKTVTLLKRDLDQQEGTVYSFVLFECRRDDTVKTGQPIQGDMTANHTTTWYIPSDQLKRNGLAPHNFNVLDRIVEDHDEYNQPISDSNKWRYWQPESGQDIGEELCQNYLTVFCVRVDPPKMGLGLG